VSSLLLPITLLVQGVFAQATEEGAAPKPMEPVPVKVPEAPVPMEAVPVAVPEAPAPVAIHSALDRPSGAPAAAEGRVKDITFSGLRRVEEAALLARMTLRPGDLLSRALVANNLRSIYETGFVEDVRIELQAAPGGAADEVRLLIVVKEKPAVREVLFEGYKKLDEEALLEVMDITPFSVLNEAEIKANISRMKDKYTEKGFYLAEIVPEVRDVGDGMVDLTFKITENKKVLVTQVEITGNDSVPDREITKYMATQEAGILPWLTSSGTYSDMAVQDDVQVVRSVFLEKGYVDIEVDPPLVFLTPDKRSVHVTINVKEGPRYKLGKIKVDGDFVESEGLTEASVRRIIEGETAKVVHERWADARKKVGLDAPLPEKWHEGRKVPLSFEPKHPEMDTGDWFQLTTLQTTLQEISDLYGDQGYAFANVVPVTQTDPESKTVDITFDIQRGNKVRLRRIDITGNDPTHDKVVRREIPIQEGDIYSGSAIKEARQRLDRLGYFEEVKITTPRGPDKDTLDMKVDVKEQPTGSFSVGAGFSNVENFMLTLNVSKNNFLGLGYVMSAAANVSRSRQQWNLQLFDPYFLDSRWTARIDGYSIAQQFIEDEFQRGGDIAFGRYLDRRDDIRMEWSYTFEDTGLNNLDSYKKRLFGGELYRSGLSSAGGMSLIVDKRNNRIQATRGVYATVSTSLAGGVRLDDESLLQIFGGDFNYTETKLNFRAYHPVVPKGEWLILKYNTTVGHIGSTDGTIVPYVQRFRAGGINSVRGYRWYTLGPSIRASGFKLGQDSTFIGSEDPSSPEDRLVVGGTETWINNIELESPIVKAAGISTVVFFDAGNAFGDPWGNGHISLTGLRASYGFGVRWFSPMGPLRFEWGFPVNPRADEQRAVFDFSIGSLF